MWRNFRMGEKNQRNKRENADRKKRVTYFAQVIGILWKTGLNFFIQEPVSQDQVIQGKSKTRYQKITAPDKPNAFKIKIPIHK